MTSAKVSYGLYDASLSQRVIQKRKYQIQKLKLSKNKKYYLIERRLA